MAAVLLLFEGVVRTLGLYRPSMYFQADTNYEWVIPGGTDIVSGLEGWGHTHYLADGEIATPYKDGAEVLVFGDSHTEGRQVDDDEKFVSVAETILRREGRQVNLRNFGRSGADFADYVYFVQQAVKRGPRPAAIVIQVDEEDFDWHAFDSARVNFFAWDAHGKLTLVHHSPRADKWTLRWWERIVLLYPLRERWNLLRDQWNPTAPTPRRRPAPEAEIERSVAAEAELMEQAAEGIPVLIVRTSYIPYVARPHSPPAVTFDTLRKVEPWPIVDPAPEFVRLRERDHIDVRTFWNTLPEQAHLNKYGNAIIGRELAEGLEKLPFPQVVAGR
jgi:lysophospholipase L1-like esterase